MPGNSFADKIALIKSRANLVDYIESVGITLKPAGVNKFRGLCPFHKEDTPSFFVFEDTQSFLCFGCHEGGDILKFVQATEMIDFMSAARLLVEKYNLDISFAYEQEEERVDYDSLYKILDFSAKYFRKNFIEAVKQSKQTGVMRECVSQITKRGLKIKGFEYGFAKNGNNLTELLLKKGFSKDLIVLSGVGKLNDSGQLYDTFRNRLIFPFYSNAGKVVGFTGRFLGDNDKVAKYLNSPTTPLFNKSLAIFNLSDAKNAIRQVPKNETKEVYVCEGQFDVIALRDSGIHNAVACSGTAISEEQAGLLRRMVGFDGKIIFALDGDQAGVSASLRLLDRVPEIHNQLYIVPMPTGLDPCDYYQAAKTKNLTPIGEYFANNQVRFPNFIIDYFAKTIGTNTPGQRVEFLERTIPYLLKLSTASLREYAYNSLYTDYFYSRQVVSEAISRAEKQVKPKTDNEGELYAITKESLERAQTSTDFLREHKELKLGEFKAIDAKGNGVFVYDGKETKVRSEYTAKLVKSRKGMFSVSVYRDLLILDNSERNDFLDALEPVTAFPVFHKEFRAINDSGERILIDSFSAFSIRLARRIFNYNSQINMFKSKEDVISELKYYIRQLRKIYIDELVNQAVVKMKNVLANDPQNDVKFSKVWDNFLQQDVLAPIERMDDCSEEVAQIYNLANNNVPVKKNEEFLRRVPNYNEIQGIKIISDEKVEQLREFVKDRNSYALDPGGRRTKYSGFSMEQIMGENTFIGKIISGEYELPSKPVTGDNDDYNSAFRELYSNLENI